MDSAIARYRFPLQRNAQIRHLVWPLLWVPVRLERLSEAAPGPGSVPESESESFRVPPSGPGPGPVQSRFRVIFSFPNLNNTRGPGVSRLNNLYGPRLGLTVTRRLATVVCHVCRPVLAARSQLQPVPTKLHQKLIHGGQRQRSQPCE